MGAYKRSLELEPDQFWTLHDLGMLLGTMGRRAEALPYLEAAREKSEALQGMDPTMRSAVIAALDGAIDGSIDFSGPTQLPIPAQGIDERWR